MENICQEGDVWHAVPDGSIAPCDTKYSAQVDVWNRNRRKFAPIAKVPRNRHFHHQERRIAVFNESASVFSLKLTSPSGRETLIKDLPVKTMNAVKALIRRHEQVCTGSKKLDYPSASAIQNFSKRFPKNTSSLYVECHDGVSGTVQECPPETFFNGAKCANVFNCGAAGAGEKWSDPSRARGYFECIDGSAVSKTCPAGSHFFGTTCVDINDDGCAGMPNGTKVRATQKSYYICDEGAALRPAISCPAAAPLFSDGLCVSPLCLDSKLTRHDEDTERTGMTEKLSRETLRRSTAPRSLGVEFHCVDGVPVVKSDIPSFQGTISLLAYKAFLDWCVSMNATDSIDNGLVPMHWAPLWPPWVPFDVTFEEAVSRNGGMITLYRLNGNMAASPFSYSIVSYKGGAWKFTQSGAREIVFRVHSTRNTVPYRPCEVVAIGDTIGWTVSTHPGLQYTFADYSGSVIFVGDENIALRISDGALQLMLRAEQGMILTDKSNPRAVRIATEVMLDASCIACPRRAWTAYFPVLPQYHNSKRQSGEFFALVNSGASVVYAITAARGSGDVFRTVSRKSHGFRTYVYSSKQKHIIGRKQIIEYSRENDKIVTKNEQNLYNFIGRRIRDNRCRNAFFFLGKRFASLVTPTDAFLCDDEGTVTHTVSHVATSSRLPFPFAPQEFIADGNESILKCKDYNTAVRVTPRLTRLNVFGFVDMSRNNLPDGYYLPLSFLEASTIPRNKVFGLPHLPLCVLRNSDDEISFTMLQDLSSDVDEITRLSCAQSGMIWDFDTDSCAELANNVLITEDLSATLFSI